MTFLSQIPEVAAAHAGVDVTVTSLAGFEPVAHLTFPVLREKLRGKAGVKLAIAQDGGFPCGLAVGVPGPNADFELASLYVLPLYRRQGLGTRLLREMEQAFVAEGCRTGASYVTVKPEDQSPLHFLRSAGWPNLRVTGLNCRTTIEKAFETSWLVKARLPDPFEVIAWQEVDEAARARISAAIGGLSPPDLSPFVFEGDAHLPTSVALRDKRDGRVRGWIITHQIGADLIRWTCSFVAPELQHQAMIIPLWLACAKRQKALGTVARFCFTVSMDQPRMAKFVARRMKPKLEEMNYSCVVLKSLLPN
ncbi:GNAT family N-acetyltransferase [Roseibium litorale]|uniref:GNAT family N-acetyltransferase n=1 Tax=Roseibium litorale TaxID=2803841 RepID=A0ABR9CK81_9HYPH|nr:GNAT family N-acetyltransferase [Roseibium litorale]